MTQLLAEKTKPGVQTASPVVEVQGSPQTNTAGVGLIIAGGFLAALAGFAALTPQIPTEVLLHETDFHKITKVGNYYALSVKNTDIKMSAKVVVTEDNSLFFNNFSCNYIKDKISGTEKDIHRYIFLHTTHENFKVFMPWFSYVLMVTLEDELLPHS